MRISIGSTVLGDSIEAHVFGESPAVDTLVIGGVHGDETEGVVAARHITRMLFENSASVAVIPVLNVDGCRLLSRQNSNGVDLNRNLHTQDWTLGDVGGRYFSGEYPNSEPENRALLDFIDGVRPSRILSLHSYKHSMININGDCRYTAEDISNQVGYPVKEDIGYPTPGSLGTYFGLERGIPVITYEFLKGMSRSDIYTIHVPAIMGTL